MSQYDNIYWISERKKSLEQDLLTAKTYGELTRKYNATPEAIRAQADLNNFSRPLITANHGGARQRAGRTKK